MSESVRLESAGKAFELVLPAASDDPVVQAYLRGEPLNDYLTDLLVRLLPRRDTVLDLGCHVGTFAIAAAAHGHRVIAVDASELHTDLVRRSAEANGFDRVTVIRAAVAAAPGTARFREQGLFGSVVDAADGTVGVPADTIAGVLQTAGDEPGAVGLIKMDIEGSELRALAGAAAWLASPGAPPIVYESNPMTAEPFGYTVDGIRTALEVLGYRTYRRLGDAVFACPPTEAQPEAWVDLLALKPAHEDALGLRVEGPLPPVRLLGVFEEWAVRPHANVRAHVGRTLARDWSELGSLPRARTILERLARDPEAEVRDAVSAALPPSFAGKPISALPRAGSRVAAAAGALGAAVRRRLRRAP